MVRRTQTTRQIAELEALYKQQFPAFARVAISLTGSVELGKEAVQEAFARAIEQVDGFRGDCPLEAWVWRIVVNTARTSARRAAYEDADATVDPEPGRANGRTDLPAVQLWVRALPERQRAVVFLRYWADLDYRSIADALEIEVGTVSATLNAAHGSLRRLLQEEVPK
jgi:RNA polymerase sigma-70 factor (ECF subfamily)